MVRNNSSEWVISKVQVGHVIATGLEGGLQM